MLNFNLLIINELHRVKKKHSSYYYIRKDINMSKYLELVGGSLTQEHLDKQKNQKPYVAYSIKDDNFIYSIKQESPYKMVDLGLNSGIKWADRNVGASSPEDTGLYFQWGDTVGYTADQVGVDKVFDWDNYKFGTSTNLTKYNSTDGLTILESVDDAATVHMGSQYRMPTIAEMIELRELTTQTFIDLDGNEYSKEQAKNGAIKSGKLKGVRFTGFNGNSIFIPAAGACDKSLLSVVGVNGRLWSSNLRYDKNAEYLNFKCNGNINTVNHYRYYGLSIRGVQA
jgi:hypothetical protein